jgi:hypothetical protein
MRSGTLGMDDDILLGSLAMPTLPPDLFPEAQNNRGRQAAGSNANRGANNRNSEPSLSWSFSDSNPLLEVPSSLNNDAAVPSAVETPSAETPDAVPDSTGEEMETAPLVPAAQMTPNDSGYGLEIPSYNPLLD